MKNSTAVTVAGVTVATGALAYAIYFDYRRRTDTTFRKKLRESHPVSVEYSFSLPLVRTRHYRQGQEEGREEHGAAESGRCHSLGTYHRAAAYGVTRPTKGATSSIPTGKGGIFHDPGQFG